MFISALFIIAKNWYQPRCPQSASEEANWGTSIKWSIIQQQKEMKCEGMKRQGGTLTTYC